MKSFHNLKMIFIHMTSHWMQKSRKNFPKFTITMWYRGPTFFKCDAVCPHHKPLCGQETISPFPNPVAIKFDGALHYHEGVDTPQKNLPSVLDYVEKSARGLPFSPAAQPAKNVGFTIRCEECQNQAWCIRISNHREHIEGWTLSYMCGISLACVVLSYL